MAKKQQAEPEIDIEEEVLNAPKMEPTLQHDDDDKALIAELAAAGEDTGMSDEDLKTAGLYDAVMKARATPEPKEPDLAADDQETEAEEEPTAEAEADEGDDEPEDDEAGAGKTVPKARLDQALRKGREERDAWAERFTKLEEQIAALSQGKPAKPEPEPAEPEVDLETQLDELAKKYDDGEMDFAEWQREQRKLVKQQDQQPSARSATQESLALQAESQRLAEANPWFDDLDAVDQSYLSQKAMAALKQQKVDTSTEFGLLRLRQAVVEIGTQLGFGQAKADTGQPPPAKGKQPTVTQKQTESKLALAGRQPPDPSGAPRARTGSVMEMDDDALMQLTDDEMAALPESTFKALQKRAGIAT